MDKISEAIIFVGLQASGKSTFYKENFFATHIRINLDMLRTRHRENLLIQACLHAKQSFVVDNTNVRIEERKVYIQAAKAAGFKVIGYYFDTDVQTCIRRNRLRGEVERISDVGLFSTVKRLQFPTLSEGFDQIYIV